MNLDINITVIWESMIKYEIASMSKETRKSIGIVTTLQRLHIKNFKFLVLNF